MYITCLYIANRHPERVYSRSGSENQVVAAARRGERGKTQRERENSGSRRIVPLRRGEHLRRRRKKSSERKGRVKKKKKKREGRTTATAHPSFVERVDPAATIYTAAFEFVVPLSRGGVVDFPSFFFGRLIYLEREELAAMMRLYADDSETVMEDRRSIL